ncbi:ORC_WH_C domain-containing protein [Pseudozyma hubeiensis]|nr:ORC_WH_C domain-containing protein [Pseudozyma hubeiensis]
MSQTEPTTSGLDKLSSACYTIPWRPKKRSKKSASSSDDARPDSGQPPFPVLTEFEADSDPALVRYLSYQIAVQRTEAIFDRCMDGVYSSLFDDLRKFFRVQQDPTHPEESTLAHIGIANEDLFLPGFESADQSRPSTSRAEGSATSIQTALLISTSAPYLSTFSNRLVSQISNASNDGPPNIVVTLSASECSNLYTALRLLVARFIAQGSGIVSTQEADLTDVEAAAFAGKIEPDLHVLGTWWQNKFAHLQQRPRLVLNLPTIESVEPVVLSDLLSALQTFVAEPSSSTSASRDASQPSSTRPQLLLVLGITSPSGGLAAVSADGIGASSSSSATSAPAPWIDYIPRQVLRVLDISRFSLPSKEIVWSQLVQTFLTSRELPLSLGPTTFEYVRETFWERDADLDSLLDAVRLAYFIHFSGKPESVFTIPGQAKRVRFFSWTPKMVERMKIAFLTTDEAGNLVLPLLADSSRPSNLDVNRFLEEASRSDQFILGELDQLRHPREVLCFRVEFAIRFLFRAFEALVRIQNRASTAAQAMHARNGSVAAQQAAEMDEQRQMERASEILTQVVMQCLNASVGSLDASKRPPAALTLRNGLARLCNAARRLLSDEFETLLDDMVAAAEDEVRRVADVLGEEGDVAEELESGKLRSAAHSISSQSASFLAGLRTFQQRLAQTIVAGTAGLNNDEDAEIVSASPNGTENGQAAQHKREARLQRVQRKLLMEEKLLGLKREITDWIVHSLHALVDWKQISRSFSSGGNGPLHLLRDIFWVDCYGPLSTLLDPSTRAGLTLPLSAPVEFVESLYDAALSVVPIDELEEIELEKLKQLQEPDVCRLFQLYLECGKFVNLADWYDAFKQTVEVDRIADQATRDLQQEDEEQRLSVDRGEGEPSTPRKKKRAVQADDDVLDTPSKRPRGRSKAADEVKESTEAELQSRFALALNELARMGMIRGTRRRQEHITKVMWDLVPDSF